MAKAELESKNEFQPVKILCTLETQGELDVFTTAFDYIPITQAKGVKRDWCKCIRKVCMAVGGKVSLRILNI